MIDVSVVAATSCHSGWWLLRLRRRLLRWLGLYATADSSRTGDLDSGAWCNRLLDNHCLLSCWLLWYLLHLQLYAIRHVLHVCTHVRLTDVAVRGVEMGLGATRATQDKLH